MEKTSFPQKYVRLSPVSPLYRKKPGMSSDGGLTGRKNGSVTRTQGRIGKIPVAGRSGI
jgi:hypothetical protein